MSATSRYGLAAAPGGLALVQDLLNTRGVPAYDVRDLLATVTDAQRWVRDAVPRWRASSGATGGVGRVRPEDLPALRELRREVDRALRGDRAAGGGAVDLVVGADGAVVAQPRGSGVGWLAGAVWGQILLAQADRSWVRLKTCRGPGCPCAFHDRSRNNSRVWHDVRTCGNLANLRASRARRSRSGTGGP